MEGLNDGRAVKTIVPQVNPRKMVCLLSRPQFIRLDPRYQIIVHAPSNATDMLIESCANIRAMTRDIYAPARGETIQIGQQTSSFSISLGDELLQSVKMSRVRCIHPFYGSGVLMFLLV
jgi:cleavage and polyadenylation specificity factor subunit 2